MRFNKVSHSVLDTERFLNTCLFWSLPSLSTAPNSFISSSSTLFPYLRPSPPLLCQEEAREVPGCEASSCCLHAQEAKGPHSKVFLKDLMTHCPFTCTISSKPHLSPGHYSHYTDEKTEAQGCQGPSSPALPEPELLIAALHSPTAPEVGPVPTIASPSTSP